MSADLPEMPDLGKLRLPQWFSHLLLVTVFGIAFSASSWVLHEVSALKEESAVNRALRENLSSDVRDIKKDIKTILEHMRP